jgi:hypothetical protein
MGKKKNRRIKTPLDIFGNDSSESAEQQHNAALSEPKRVSVPISDF